jgi:phosphoribosylaminoimidazole (AIR) synthetase
MGDKVKEGEWNIIDVGGLKVITGEDLWNCIMKVRELEGRIQKLEEDVAKIFKMLDDIAKKIV